MLHNLTSDGDKISTRDRLVPYAMFTEPELGRVGITERVDVASILRSANSP